MPLPPPFSLDNPDSRSVFIVGLVFPVLATLAVIGRYAARWLRRAPLRADDYVVTAALIAVYGQATILVLSVFYGGVGHHLNTVSSDHLVVYFKFLASVQFSFGLSLGLAKISILLLLMRVFPGRKFHRIAWCVLAYCAAWTIMVWSIGAGLCRPFSCNWNRTAAGCHCAAGTPAYVSIAALDIVGDLMIIILPMKSVWDLHANLNTKVGLSMVFGLGLLDIIVSILRIVYLLRIDYGPGGDFTYQSVDTYIWSIIEPCLGVIVACGPTLRPLWQSAKGKVTSTTSRSGASDHHPYHLADIRGSGRRPSRYDPDAAYGVSNPDGGQWHRRPSAPLQKELSGWHFDSSKG